VLLYLWHGGLHVIAGGRAFAASHCQKVAFDRQTWRKKPARSKPGKSLRSTD
jgi:hypothetical protein